MRSHKIFKNWNANNYNEQIENNIEMTALLRSILLLEFLNSMANKLSEKNSKVYLQKQMHKMKEYFKHVFASKEESKCIIYNYICRYLYCSFLKYDSKTKKWFLKLSSQLLIYLNLIFKPLNITWNTWNHSLSYDHKVSPLKQRQS